MIRKIGDRELAVMDWYTPAEWKEKIEKEFADPLEQPDIRLGHICAVFVVSHIVGFALKELPQYVTKIGLLFGYSTENSLYIGLSIATLFTIIIPMTIKKPTYSTMVILDIIALLEFGNLLLCVSMYNISLAMFCGVLYVPFALLIAPTKCKYEI